MSNQKTTKKKQTNSQNGNARRANKKAKNPNAKNPNAKNPNAKNPNAKNPNAKNSRNKQNGNKQNGNSGKRGGDSNKQSRNRKRKKSKFNSRQFWGSATSLPEPVGYQTSTADPTAVVASLGRPPIPGSETAAEHYFQLLYNRSAALAGALAVAGGLDQVVAAPKESPIDVAPDLLDDEDVANDDEDNESDEEE